MRLIPSLPPLRHGLLHLALALMLLLAQQGALRHALEHEAEPGHPVHSQCLICLACHAVDHAAAGTPVVIPPGSDALAAQVPHRPTPAVSHTALTARARGPPAFLA
jgi:hypothetical protein